MNTSSDRMRRLMPWGGLAALLALGACIQGPWDYYPENPPPFRGIFVTGYAVAGEPLHGVCFEKMLKLDEEATQAFPFYAGAEVRVTGRFSGQVRTMILAPIADTANCFAGDTGRVERGEDYALEASIAWDSSGRRVTSTITGTAHVPRDFKVRDSAVAPALAEHGGVPSNIFSEAFIRSLPPEVLLTLAAEFDSLQEVFLSGDSTRIVPYLQAHGRAIQARLIELLGQYKFVYHDGGTVFYLNGALNTLSHYFTADRSDDVKAVLVTQRFDPDSARPETRFDNPFGGEPDTGDYYFPGSLRRLLIYPDAKGQQGWNLLDSMGVVNVWFHTGLNRLYFYGVEQAYMAFNASATNVQGGGGGPDGDPRVKPQYNVQGGMGIFIGAVPDSFDVHVRVDTLTKAYPMARAHAHHCSDIGWGASEDCRGYYRSYCDGRDWKGNECWSDAVTACLEAGLAGDTALTARCAPMADSARAIGNGQPFGVLTARDGVRRFCVAGAFPASVPECAGDAADCRAEGTNDCKEFLWEFCKDELWKPAQCGGFGLAGYCKDKGRTSEVLCSRADAWCGANPGEPECE